MQKPGAIRHAALAAFACVAIAASSITAVALASAPALAWQTEDFNNKNIIDDALFYDGEAMTANEVQSFLNQKSPNTGAALRNYKTKTKSKAANANCKAYAGKSSETAAQVIAKVGQACGISQKTILVTLQKETSLVTLSPEKWRYDRAMGYACPDSGPGRTANCNTNYYGFFNQVYSAAWQFKNYMKYPMSGIKKGTTSKIRWHPSNCTTSSFFIENYATAALYTYTPYRPNSAALKAGWGTGNKCSSYGNRNFFNYWNQWFGSVRSNLQITGAIKKVYDAAEAAGASYGSPLSPRKKITANGGGYQMAFENGIITQSTALGVAYGVRNSTANASDTWANSYIAQGGAGGKWGFVVGTVQTSGYRTLKFQNGTAVANGAVTNGVRFVPAPIYSAWLKSGSSAAEIAAGPYGWPKANASMPTSSSASQQFEKATIMASGAKSTLVTPDEYQQWQALGGYNAIGFYIAPTTTLGAKSYRDTDKGTLYFTSATARTFLPNGSIRSAYLSAKGPAGSWGWPSSGQKSISGGMSAGFANGTAVYSSAKRKSYFMRTRAYADWIKHGGPKSSWGYPTAHTKVLKDGSYQRYAKHASFYGPKKTLTSRRDGIINAYLAQGGPESRWGWPLSGSASIRGGARVTFSAGYGLYEKRSKRTVLITKAAYADWVRRGGTRASVGYPTKHTSVLADGSYQHYREHLVFFGPKKKIALRKDAAIRAYFAAGGPKRSGWGWPLATSKKASNGTITMKFSKGTATITKRGKVTFK